MKDRIVEFPNRYKLKPVNGTTDTYDLEAVPGTVTAAGDNLNKANLLDDNTCTLLSLSTNAVPNEAFQKIILGNKYAFSITVKNSNGKLLSNITLTGVTGIDGSACVTDSNGKALAVATAPNPTITFDGTLYADLSSTSQAVQANGVLTNVSMTIPSKNTGKYLRITSSQTIKFSSAVASVDICIVGGGGGGAAGYGDSESWVGGGGGGGGDINNLLGRNPSGKEYTMTIGAGGTGSTNNDYSNRAGTGGGISTVVEKQNGQITSSWQANGGGGGGYQNGGSSSTGGKGGAFPSTGGWPGPGENGHNCTVYEFNDSTKTLYSGGGGGGSTQTGGSAATGGLGYGGNGGFLMTASAQSGNGYGGGGGGGAAAKSTYSYGGNGCQGCVSFQWRFAV